MTWFEAWPYRWYGIWKSGPDDPAHLPTLNELTDASWSPPDLGQLAAYLRGAPIVLIAMIDCSISCELCQENLGNPGQYQSDGVWLWPSGLAHFVEKHSLRLPDSMVEHVRSVLYSPPARISGPIEELPWPTI
jgi:hypothetical protein